ncbi:hypothetical protein [Sebaldella sp. S0638]|uniref:hypothetical protein n=1 Tax=Sebaldella sp. S0638 TaxID=2957809 RepID=UPI00209EAE90|nr:hypothetical protein [Sebaldella sp. S0638]MCP1225458.1 hypothetical protein [Sebaldella sp. S0638]
MEKFILRLGKKSLTMEDAFNWSFEILKSNIKTLFPSLVILMILRLGSRMFFGKEDTFFWNILILSYGGLSSFISSVIYTGLRVEISDYIEKEKKLRSSFASGRKLWQKIIFIALLYFTFLFTAGVIMGIFILFLTIIGNVSMFLAVCCGIAALTAGIAGVIFFKVRLAFFQNIYYVRKLGVVKSILYSFHITKNYFIKIFLTNIIFWFLVFILEIMLTFSSFINFFSKNIWLVIVTVIAQSIICFVISFLINVKVGIISLFYLNAEYKDLQTEEENNKTT